MQSNLLTAALTVMTLIGAGPARADLSALVVSEPTSRRDVAAVSRINLEAQLTRAAGQPVAVAVSEDLTDAMRATRSKGYDLYMAPAQVAASAIAHGHELLGSTAKDDDYVLVGAASIGSLAEMRNARIYLPQQDSIYTYLARGMLNVGGLSFHDLKHVQYARYPQAGLIAISIHQSDATVTRRFDFDAWAKEFPGQGKVLASAGSVPGGLSVTINRELSPDLRARIAKFFGGAVAGTGLQPVVVQADLAQYKRIAELGTFTPTLLPGVTVVNATEVARLMSQGATVVDTRTEKEFQARHIPGAVFVPYHEKSLKDVAYDPALDDFSGLAKLDATKATIFHCNGAECWKSYKASKAARAKGFSKVYWFRGGMPDWEKAGQQVALH